MNKIEAMYEAIQEVVCAFALHQEAIEKAKNQKKSMLKAFQEMNVDLDNAFRVCFDTIEKIKNEELGVEV